MGYLKETIRYYFYHPIERKVFISKYATFLEKEFFLKGNNGSQIELEEVQEPQTDIQMEQEPETVISTVDTQAEIPL